MKLKRFFIGAAGCLVFTLTGCAALQPKPPVDTGSVSPGGEVFRGEKRFSLLGSPIVVGRHLPSAKLVDAATMKDVDLSEERGEVLFLSIVPSLDTKVCDAQTHVLSEEGDKFLFGIKRITISRDTPFAQKRFADEARLTDIQYLSDYKRGDFGRATGLLMEGIELLARSVVLVDGDGIVRYIQVVPEMTHMPDMERAFGEAVKIKKEKGR